VHGRGELPSHPEFEDYPWWQDHGYEAGKDPLTGDLVKTIALGNIDRPVWLIEVLHRIPPAPDGPENLQVWYRILARGSGQTKAAVSVIESIVVRSWPSLVHHIPSNPDIANSCFGFESEAKCGRVSWRELR